MQECLLCVSKTLKIIVFVVNLLNFFKHKEDVKENLPPVNIANNPSLTRTYSN